jgi:replicative DNA helicase
MGMSYNLGLDAVKHVPESHATELKGGQVIKKKDKIYTSSSSRIFIDSILSLCTPNSISRRLRKTQSQAKSSLFVCGYLPLIYFEKRKHYVLAHTYTTEMCTQRTF